MKIILLVLALACACLASEPVERQLNYHSAVGVPLAQRIRAAEAAADAAGTNQRVAGGVAANPADFPYFAGLLITLDNGFTSVCGATLISNTRLLTAAHCWFDGRVQGLSVTVVLASTWLFFGGVRVQAERVEMHQRFNPRKLFDDIAMITIPHIEYTNVIRPVRLPNGWGLSSNTFQGELAQVIGYGVSRDNEEITIDQSLQRVQVLVGTFRDCQAVYGFDVDRSNVCTSGQGRVGPCAGDSGGPLVTRYDGEDVLIGVTSYHAGGGCDIGYPAVFTRVNFHEHWIEERL